MGTLNYFPSPTVIDDGGARRDRTADLLHAMQALSQLSYSPAAQLQQSSDFRQTGRLCQLKISTFCNYSAY